MISAMTSSTVLQLMSAPPIPESFSTESPSSSSLNSPSSWLLQVFPKSTAPIPLASWAGLFFTPSPTNFHLLLGNCVNHLPTSYLVTTFFMHIQINMISLNGNNLFVGTARGANATTSRATTVCIKCNNHQICCQRTAFWCTLTAGGANATTAGDATGEAKTEWSTNLVKGSQSWHSPLLTQWYFVIPMCGSL